MAPKFYILKKEKNEVVKYHLKVKGCTLSHETEQIVTMEKMRHMVDAFVDSNGEVKELLKVPQTLFATRKFEQEIHTSVKDKILKVTGEKRLLCNKGDTIPFGTCID